MNDTSYDIASSSALGSVVVYRQKMSSLSKLFIMWRPWGVKGGEFVRRTNSHSPPCPLWHPTITPFRPFMTLAANPTRLYWLPVNRVASPPNRVSSPMVLTLHPLHLAQVLPFRFQMDPVEIMSFDPFMPIRIVAKVYHWPNTLLPQTMLATKILK